MRPVSLLIMIRWHSRYFDEDDDNDGFRYIRRERFIRYTDDPLNQYGGGVYYLPGDGFSTQYDPEGGVFGPF